MRGFTFGKNIAGFSVLLGRKGNYTRTNIGSWKFMVVGVRGNFLLIPLVSLWRSSVEIPEVGDFDGLRERR